MCANPFHSRTTLPLPRVSQRLQLQAVECGSRFFPGTQGSPLWGIHVQLHHWNGHYWAWSTSEYTQEGGGYEIGGLPPGIYRVQFSDWQDQYLTQYHDNKATIDEADDVFVTEGEITTGIDATLVHMLPDFVVQSIEISPPRQTAGRIVTATVTVKNQGYTDGDAGLLAVWYDRPEPPEPGDPSHDDSTESGWIHTGETRTFSFRFEAPGPAGPKTFRAYVNSDHAGPETFYHNNQLTGSYTVKDRPMTLPGVLLLLLEDEDD